MISLDPTGFKYHAEITALFKQVEDPFEMELPEVEFSIAGTDQT